MTDLSQSDNVDRAILVDWVTDLSQSDNVDRAILINWVLERLDDLKCSLADIEDGIYPPHLPPRVFDVPDGALASLDVIADAIFGAEGKWSQ